MLLTDDPDRNAVPFRIDYVKSELAFGLEDALCVVTQGPVAEVSMELLGRVEPRVNLQVVLRYSAEPSC